MASLVRCPPLDFDSCHDLWGVGLSPTLGSMLDMESVWGLLPLPSPLPLAHTLSLSLSNK